jgi:hypothetical protein
MGGGYLIGGLAENTGSGRLDAEQWHDLLVQSAADV